MKVNNLIERKNKRELIRAGKVQAKMQASQASKFSSAANSTKAKGKLNKNRKGGAKPDGKRASKSSKFDTKMLVPRSDASSDEFDFEQKEKKHK